MTKKTFKEKLKGEGYPKVVAIPPKMEKRLGPGRMLVPAPWQLEELMAKVAEGQLTTVSEIRAALAEKHGVEETCGIVTGISVRVVAGAAEEDREAGLETTTPYWRTLKKDGELNDKLPGGIPAQRKHLEAEGHTVAKRGKRWFVEDLDEVLVEFY